MGVRTYIHRRRLSSSEGCILRRNESLGLAAGIGTLGTIAFLKAAELSDVSPIFIAETEVQVISLTVGIVGVAACCALAYGEHADMARYSGDDSGLSTEGG